MEDFPPFVNTNHLSTPPKSDQNSSTTYNTPTSSKIATLRKEMEKFKVSIRAETTPFITPTKSDTHSTYAPAPSTTDANHIAPSQATSPDHRHPK
eukprot:695936-Ditylum_brightwellii.AAC.1